MTLSAAAFGGPVHEILQVAAVFPGEAKEFRGRHVVGFFAQKSFKSPAQVRTLPRLEAVAACNDPVIAQRSKHCRSAFNSRRAGDSALSRMSGKWCANSSKRFNQTTTSPWGRKDVREPAPSSGPAFPKFQCSEHRLRWICRPLFSWTGAWERWSRQSCRGA
jgi:hypothetical protein